VAYPFGQIANYPQNTSIKLLNLGLSDEPDSGILAIILEPAEASGGNTFFRLSTPPVLISRRALKSVKQKTIFIRNAPIQDDAETLPTRIAFDFSSSIYTVFEYRIDVVCQSTTIAKDQAGNYVLSTRLKDWAISFLAHSAADSLSHQRTVLLQMFAGEEATSRHCTLRLSELTRKGTSSWVSDISAQRDTKIQILSERSLLSMSDGTSVVARVRQLPALRVFKGGLHIRTSKSLHYRIYLD
jgi:hypothetical protein